MKKILNKALVISKILIIFISLYLKKLSLQIYNNKSHNDTSKLLYLLYYTYYTYKVIVSDEFVEGMALFNMAEFFPLNFDSTTVL